MGLFSGGLTFGSFFVYQIVGLIFGWANFRVSLSLGVYGISLRSGIMLWAHMRNHDARDVTMSIACGKAWILGAKRLATSVTFSCVRCRFLHKVKTQQQMSQPPPLFSLHVLHSPT